MSLQHCLAMSALLFGETLANASEVSCKVLKLGFELDLLLVLLLHDLRVLRLLLGQVLLEA